MSTATQDALLKQLKNPFDPKFVKWRIGSTTQDKTKGQAVAYIDAREVRKRFDEVCRIGGWQDRLIPCTDGFICEISVLIDDKWTTKTNAAGYTKVEAVKGGASDAFKRAATMFGVGVYLYYLPKIWLPIKQAGKSYVLAEIPELPDWALPGKVENWEDIAEMETDLSSGEDDIDVDTIVSVVDTLRAAQTKTELAELIKNLSPDDRLIYANQIEVKRKELEHNAKINSDNN
jgi:hypothetical protein